MLMTQASFGVPVTHVQSEPIIMIQPQRMQEPTIMFGGNKGPMIGLKKEVMPQKLSTSIKMEEPQIMPKQ